VLRVRVLRDGEATDAVLAEIRSFVSDAFDGRFSDEDWEHTAGGVRIVVFDGNTPLAHGAVVPRDLRVANHELRAGYVEGVATHRERQRQGLGSRIMTHVTGIVREGFEIGGLSTGRRGFYERFGWESWRGPSFVQNGDDLVRTPCEDDALMVLRFGPSAGVDLGAPIVCRSRAGDDW
jgi:aminoglycoside 2'-N-acetyltransferase I